MLTFYNPQSQTQQTTAGVLSAETLLLNVLIELRAMNEILLGNAGSNSAASLRSDVVNETNNTPI